MCFEYKEPPVPPSTRIIKDGKLMTSNKPKKSASKSRIIFTVYYGLLFGLISYYLPTSWKYAFGFIIGIIFMLVINT